MPTVRDRLLALRSDEELERKAEKARRRGPHGIYRTQEWRDVVDRRTNRLLELLEWIEKENE